MSPTLEAYLRSWTFEPGADLGAHNQTGWTALIASLLFECGGRDSA
jgi:hypothetical protein